MPQDNFLHHARAWNWQWPDEKNRWVTNAQPRGASTAYSGPSKKTLKKRATRRARRRQ